MGEAVPGKAVAGEEVASEAAQAGGSVQASAIAQAGAPVKAGEGEEPSIASAAAVYGLLASLLRRAPRDISLTSLATLSTLDRTGTKRITELAAIEGVTQPSMTTLIASLERQGLVERGGDPSDRRVSLVSLTRAGREYMLRRRHAGTEAFATLVSQLPPDEAAALTAAIPALSRLRDLDNALRDATVRAR